MSLKGLLSFLALVLALNTAYSALANNELNPRFNITRANYLINDSAYYAKAVNLIQLYNTYSANVSSTIKNAIGTHIIRLELSFLNGYNITMGIKTVNGLITEYNRTPFNLSTMVIHLSESAVLDILSSINPFRALSNAWGTKIKFNGLTLFASITSSFVNAGFGIYSFFSGLLSGGLLPLVTIYSGPRSSGVNINLASWWHDVPADNDIQIDSLGGVAYLFWLDDNGNICHGDPGINGQSGPVMLLPSRAHELDSIVDDADVLSISYFASIRNDTYSLGSYDGTGSHLLIYRNQMWRGREEGIAFEDLSAIQSSYPIDIDLSSTTLTPNRLWPYAMLRLNDYKCSLTEYGDLPLPAMPSSGTQDPTKCLHKQTITGASIAAACKAGTLTGSLTDGYIRI